MGKTKLYCLGIYKENYIKVTSPLPPEDTLCGSEGTGKGHRGEMWHVS